VINDILDFSKIEAGKLSFDFTDFNLRDTIGDMMSSLAYRSHEKGLELASHILPDVPDALVGDPSRLRQVIVNLVGNSIKFTDEGEIVVRVMKENVTKDGVAIHFSISDTGIGIAPEKQRQIFEAFTQVDGSATRNYGGTGLGLTISSQLVSYMGGRIWVESKKGKGSTFHFTANFGLQDDQSIEPMQHDPGILNGLPVLVVDDNATNRRILHELLRNWNMKPRLADSSEAALQELTQANAKGKPFVLMLLDLQMPVVDGFGLMEKINAIPECGEMKVILLSSSVAQGIPEKCRQLEINDHLTKPVKQSDLLNSIFNVLLDNKLADSEESVIAGMEAAANLQGSRISRRVLLVEDNEINQKLAVRFLEKQGHDVQVAKNGKVALDILENATFDVVLMDLQMPVMGGFDATKQIRKRDSERGTYTPIVAMTAHAMAGDKERCLRAGMDGYLSKPIQSAELFKTVESFGPAPDRSGPLSSDSIVSRPEDSGSHMVFNKQKLLSLVDNDEELLMQIVDVFLTEYPGMIAEIRKALEEGDNEKLEHAAHSLKGSVGNFAAGNAVTVAQKLENLGRENKLERARQVLEKLEEELDNLKRELRTITK